MELKIKLLYLLKIFLENTVAVVLDSIDSYSFLRRHSVGSSRTPP